MSVESIGGPVPEEQYTTAEREHGIKTAVGAILNVRRLIRDHQAWLDAERAEKVVDLGIIKHHTNRLTELKGQLEDNLAFLEVFDPELYKEMKEDNTNVGG